MSATDNLKLLLLKPETPLREVLGVMTNPPGSPLVCIAEDNARLLGVLVDYDIRQALLAGKTLETPAREVMNAKPVWLPDYTDDHTLYKFFRRRPLKAVPLLDSQRRVTRVAFLNQYLAHPGDMPNWVVLMAGGLGTRLRPLTYHTPKPMVQVGDRPILDTILRQFRDASFSRFYVSVCYKGQQIKDYFGDGSHLDAEIRYLEEREPLGTAGCLSLLPEAPEHPLIVMNGDLLTRVNPKALLDFHESSGHLATMCVREHLMEVPYGVVEVNGTFLEELVEKPVYRLMVNAGIYVLEPEVLEFIPPGQRTDMPQLFQSLKAQHGKLLGCFPVSEYWRDIGRQDDYSDAQNDYERFFAERETGRLAMS
jgi:dTDP-glucose pyrophosphorylase